MVCISQRFAFTGREWDEDAGLYYYRARWYDPELGRFLSEDPIGFAAGDANLQRYVANIPTGYVDPSGLHGMIIGGGMHAPRPRPPMVPWDDVDKSPSRQRIHEMLGDNEDLKKYVDELLRLALEADRRRSYWGDMRNIPYDPDMGSGAKGPCAWFAKRFMDLWLKWSEENPLPSELKVSIEDWVIDPRIRWNAHVHYAIVVQVWGMNEDGDQVELFRFYLDAGKHRAEKQGNLGCDNHIFFPEDIPPNYRRPPWVYKPPWWIRPFL